MNPALVALCQDILIEMARLRGTITYGELAAQLGVANQNIGAYLNAVYNELVVNQGLPDLTLLAVYSGTRYGRFNSRGLPAQTVVFDPDDPDQCARYDEDRNKVYQHWAAEG